MRLWLESARQSHSRQDLVESRVHAQRVEAGVCADPYQALPALVVCVPEQFDGAVIFAQADVYEREMEGGDAPQSLRPLQFVEHPQSLLPLPRFGVSVSEFGSDQNASGGDLK